MSPDKINSILSSRANVTRECLERVGRMTDQQVEALADEYTRVLSAQRTYDARLRASESGIAVRGAAPPNPPDGPRPEMPTCAYEAQLERPDRRSRAVNMQLRVSVTAFYAIFGAAIGYVAGREVMGSGREGAAAGSVIAAIAGFIATKDVHPGGGSW